MTKQPSGRKAELSIISLSLKEVQHMKTLHSLAMIPSVACVAQSAWSEEDAAG